MKGLVPCLLFTFSPKEEKKTKKYFNRFVLTHYVHFFNELNDNITHKLWPKVMIINPFVFMTGKLLFIVHCTSLYCSLTPWPDTSIHQHGGKWILNTQCSTTLYKLRVKTVVIIYSFVVLYIFVDCIDMVPCTHIYCLRKQEL